MAGKIAYKIIFTEDKKTKIIGYEEQNTHNIRNIKL